MAERVSEGQQDKKKVVMTVIGGIANADPTTDVVRDGDFVRQRYTKRGEAYVAFDNDVTQTFASESEGATDIAVPSKATYVAAEATAATPNNIEGTLAPLSQDLRGGQRVRVDLAQAADNATAPTQSVQVGGLANAAAQAYSNGDIAALSVDASGGLRTRIDLAQAADNAAAPSQTVQVGGLANASAQAYSDDDIAALSLDASGGARVRVDLAQGTHDSGVPTMVLMNGQYAETTVPTAVADADVVRPWYDEYGRPIGKPYDFSSGSDMVTAIAPEPIGPFSATQLDEPGTTEVFNVHGMQRVCAMVTVGGSPAASTFILEGSHDNSNWFQLSLQTTTMRVGWTVANNQATCSATGTFELLAINICTEYVRGSMMDVSGSPESVTSDWQFMASK